MNKVPSSQPHSDVRMKGFSSRKTVEVALRWVDEHSLPLTEETIDLRDGSGRVLSQAVSSRIDVPGFDRAMMDGFAVQSNDTLGATPYNPLPLQIVGEVFPGQPFEGTIERGQAVRIMTGAPMPAGADAVLPAEKTQSSGETVLAQGEVPTQKHLGRRGEDIQAESLVLHQGRKLRPQDLGVLSSIGVGQIQVYRRPRVRVLITGNELVPSGTPPTPHKIADANGPMLTALVERDGGHVTNNDIIPDHEDSILTAMQDDVDVVLVSGGSSVGLEDHAPRLLAEHGELAIHGIAMRPSSPSGMGLMDQRKLFLLPGNPVSCLCAYDFFAGRAIRQLGGRPAEWPYRRIRLPLQRKLVSQIGRVDYARVALEEGKVEPVAISGASLLSSTTRADGFVIISADSEGYPPGHEIEVFLYDDEV